MAGQEMPRGWKRLGLAQRPALPDLVADLK
jgi:hypothetical protein